jgi:predicted TIM-barrel fold metal-dependent hydrolase
MARYYSCDSHVVEPPEVFEGLEERFGSRAPQVLRNDRGAKATVVLGGVPIPVARFGIAGHRLDDPATTELIRGGYPAMNPGVFDPAARLEDQRRDGIEGEVMYPSLNMLTFSLTDREVAHAIFRRHNDWIRDYCSHAPERLIGVACLPLPDVDEAVAELERVASMGIRGVAIPCAAPPDRPYHHPSYERFWDAAEDTGLPITMHIFTGTSWNMGLPEHWGPPAVAIAGYTLAFSSVAASFIQLICGGVLARHPKLRIVGAEFETGWVGHFLQRLDHATYRARSEASPDLELAPSEYFHRQCYVTFEDDELGVRQRDVIGVDNMLWGNDYPHHDSIWPRSMETLARTLAGVPAPEVRKMTFENVVSLYGIRLGGADEDTDQRVGVG